MSDASRPFASSLESAPEATGADASADSYLVSRDDAHRPSERRFGRRRVRTTPVFDTYWRFAAERQNIFMRRVAGVAPPWTEDTVLAHHRFTNVYRAADRVSQYLIRHVLYEGAQTIEEVFFRTMLFKLFNRIETWQELTEHIGALRWEGFDIDCYAAVLDRMIAEDRRVYSAAYIMPSPSFGSPRKHRNHLQLLAHMMRSGAPRRIVEARSLQEAFGVLRSYPSLGDFLAFQYIVDLNYSAIIDFSEMEFVVAGPGARDGIRKCFTHVDDLNDADVIKLVTECAEAEFERLELEFQTLWGRPLQLIDCQNLFCEVSKYARVLHPEAKGLSARTRIKQRFVPVVSPVPQWYPPKWRLRSPTEPVRDVS